DLDPAASACRLDSTSHASGDVIIFGPFLSLGLIRVPSLYHQDQNSTLNVRATRRVTRSQTRLGPQKILACPVISGFGRRDWLSIWVVTTIVLLMLAALPEDMPASACSLPPAPPWAAVAMEVTIP